MKILNLYGGIGGNRKKWGERHEITTVELDENVAKIYADYFPNDNLIVGDAHDFLINNFQDFDFIWSSPPCPSHSRLRTMQKEIIYPDMTLYQEILLLKQWFKGGFCVENVEPYYGVFVPPTMTLHRHFFWSNFFISKVRTPKMETCKKLGEREFLEKELDYDLSKYSGIDKRKCLRNCVLPDVGFQILSDFISGQQHNLF